ncbi:hypothetical protein [Micromonospora sp. SL4-19]|uniref:hypothetical protein n=1 Tax=Micromonospora sp. SL4-19 TaxID=3399129 RepID=UPI003A4DB3D9
MEVKGNQYGNIQNSDVIINHGSLSAAVSDSGQEALRALGELHERVRAAGLSGGLDEKIARAVAEELVSTRRELAAGGGVAAISGLERTRRILGTAIGAAPLLEAISKIIGLIHSSAGS